MFIEENNYFVHNFFFYKIEAYKDKINVIQCGNNNMTEGNACTTHETVFEL
jgi:hypothetical protein